MKLYRSRVLMAVLLAVMIGLFLTACGGNDEPTPTPEPQVVDTPVPPPPTDTPVPPPTDTPVPPPPTETPMPDLAADFTLFESDEGGYSVKYPGDWVTAGFAGITTLASNEALLDAPDPGEEGGIAIIVSGDAADFTSSDPVEMMTEAVSEFGLASDAEMTEGPTAVTINGKDGATAVINGTNDNGSPFIAFVTIIADEARSVIMIAATPAETEADFRPTFEAMANSIEVYEPTAPEVNLPTSEGFLLYGDTTTGAVTADGPSTWEFIGLEGEVIDIIVRPLADDFDAILDVLDESGNSILEFEIDESFGVEELRGFTLPASGNFFIVISGFADSVGDYELTLAEAGTLTGAEGVISYGETLSGSVISEDGSTWSFSGTEGDFVDITVVPFNEFDLVVDVLDSSGLSILDESPIDVSFDTEFIRVQRLPSSGQYTILITGFKDEDGNSEIGDYELTLGLSNGGQPGSIIFANATLNAENIEGHAFPFSALAGEVVTFQVDPVFELDVIVEVYNDDTDELLEEADLYTGFEEIVFTVPEDGNYYFQVKRFEETAGDYEATILGADTVIFELAVGDGVIGRFNEDGIIEYLFRGAAGSVLVLTAETDDELDLVLEILDMDDNSLAQVDDEMSGGSETLTYTFETDQPVFIRVSEFFSEQGQFILLLDAE